MLPWLPLTSEAQLYAEREEYLSEELVFMRLYVFVGHESQDVLTIVPVWEVLLVSYYYYDIIIVVS